MATVDYELSLRYLILRRNLIVIGADMISGINGNNFILASMAKIRVEEKMVDKAKIVGGNGGYVIEFHGPCAEWHGEPVVLCSATDPYRPWHFKSLDGAMSQFIGNGLDKLSIIIE